MASTISTPRLESDTGPTAEHRTGRARALGWADEAAARGDHATGINAHGDRPVQTAPNPRSADRKGCRTNEISGRGLLDVMADFDQFGGASRELVAWELCMEESAVSAAWSRAIADGLLERSGTDDVPGEVTWRLTTRGRRAYESSDDV